MTPDEKCLSDGKKPTKMPTGLSFAGFDGADLLLLLILYLLYKESGDEESLIILAVTAFSMLGKNT